MKVMTRAGSCLRDGAACSYARVVRGRRDRDGMRDIRGRKCRGQEAELTPKQAVQEQAQHSLTLTRREVRTERAEEQLQNWQLCRRFNCGSECQQATGIPTCETLPASPLRRFYFVFLPVARLRARWYLVQRARAGFTRSGRVLDTWLLMHLATRLKSRLKSLAHTVSLSSLHCSVNETSTGRQR